MKNKLLAAFCLLLAGGNLLEEDFEQPAPTKGEVIYYTADENVFDKNNSVVAIKGKAEKFIEDGQTTRGIKGADIQEDL